SFLFLVEFARQQAIRFELKLPGRWVYVPLIILVMLSGLSGGGNSAGVLARYMFGFTCAMSTSLAFVLHSREISRINRRLAISAATGFAIYAVAAGLIVPAAPFWPANTFNYGWFAELTGMPIQLVRGTLACWMAFSVWAIWGHQLISEVASARYTSY